MDLYESHGWRSRLDRIDGGIDRNADVRRPIGEQCLTIAEGE